MQAIVEGATLGGRQSANVVDAPTLARMILVALGQDDVDEIISRLYPDGEPLADMHSTMPQSEAMMVEAVKELRSALVRLRG